MPSSKTLVQAASTSQPAATQTTGSFLRHGGHWIWQDGLCALLLAGGVLLAYSEVFSCGFVNYDDGQYVTQNPLVLAGLTEQGFRWAWTTAYAANWHPLTWLSLMLDATVFGPHAWGFHLTSLLLHLLNTLLLFVLFRWLTGVVWRSAMVAALFGLHPLHVESVAWISERKDVLSAFFGLLALLAYVAYAKRPGLGRYLLIVLGMVLSLLAKPMWLTLPGMLLLLDYWPLRCWTPAADTPTRSMPLKWLLAEKIPFVLLSAASVAVTLWAQRSGGALRSLAHVSFSERLSNALLSYGEYLRQMVWPANLACFYPYPHSAPSVAVSVLAALVVLLITAAAVRWGRKVPYVPMGWLWYLGTLVPVIGLVSFGLAARADRYTYVPFIGIFIVLVWGTADLAAWLGHARRAAAVAWAVLVACMVLTWVQVQVWADSITLWTHDLVVVGSTEIGHSNLAAAYEEKGNTRQAVEHFQQAIRCNPDYAPAHGALGLILLRHGQAAEAVCEFRASLRTDPEPARSHANLGRALLEQGQEAEAIHHLEKALDLRPEDRGTRVLLVSVLLHAGHADVAGQQLDQALRLEPDAADLQQLRGLAYLHAHQPRPAETCFHRAVDLQPGSALYHRRRAYALQALGQSTDAQKEYQEASRLDPRWPQLALARAWLLATASDAAHRDGTAAVLEAEQGRQAIGDQDPHVLDILAAAYAEAGRFAEAVVAARQAHARALALKQTDFAAEIGRRLHNYENQQPYRTPAPPERLPTPR